MVKMQEFFGYTYSGKSSGAPVKGELNSDLSFVFDVMRPRASPFELLRIGGAQDGAYLLPNDLSGVAACFSPGACNRKGFEDQLSVEYGINCHICDFTSDEDKFSTPFIKGRQTFDKLWLDPVSGPESINIRDWIDKYYDSSATDFILQMDIEGAEYKNLLGIEKETLERFRIVVLEVHGLSSLVDESILSNVLKPFFSKLSEDFICIHAHPNNCSNEVFIQEIGINVGDAMEFTFLNRRRFSRAGKVEAHPVALPHPLDIVNDPGAVPIILNEKWSGGARPIEAKIKILDEKFDYIRSLFDKEREDLNKSLMNAFNVALRSEPLKCDPLGADLLGPVDRQITEEVAAGKQYKLSSSHDGPLSNIVPPTVTKPYFFHTRLDDNQSITIDLTEIRTVRNIIIANRTDACFDRPNPLFLSIYLNREELHQSRVFSLVIPPSFLSGQSSQISVLCPATRGRFVTLLTPLKTALHFSQIRVFADKQ